MSDLRGVAVLVTRPEHQAHDLCAALSAAGANPIAFPTLAIEPLMPINSLQADIIIFTSPNAVACGLNDSTTLNGTIIAIGPGTQKSLINKGFYAILPVSPYYSESVLAMAELDEISGKKVALIAGVGGREMLQEELTSRGAMVMKNEVYRRVKPLADINMLDSFWCYDERVITVTSSEALDNLIAMVPEKEHPLLIQTPLLVVGGRQAKRAHDKSFQHVRVSDGAGVGEMIDGLRNIKMDRITIKS